MSFRVCQTCEGDGRICPKCRKRWGHRGDGRAFGQLKNKHRRSIGGCGVKRGDSIACPSHVESFWECDFCLVRAPGTERPNIWTREHIPGANAGRLADACPSCVGCLRVGYDYALNLVSAGSGTVVESLACAWAFHLGQYFEAAEREGWEGKGPHRADVGDWMAPTFTAPATLGRYGWGRWSEVRRGADAMGGGGMFVAAITSGQVLTHGEVRELTSLGYGQSIDVSIIDEGSQ